ncbi:MAG: hypothetical protein ACI9LM_003480 [Alteromonadaceae bacterium]|jgi:hypothetical protein
MIKYIHTAISSTLNFIFELKNLSISQWDVEQNESIIHSDIIRQKR